ncbi:MAG: hypothetical protein ACHQ1G_06285 [Planctomycetota bacterium]
MRKILLGVLGAVLAGGCSGITETILGTILDGFEIPGFETPVVGPVTYDPPQGGTLSGARLAFVAAEDGDVSCLILSAGSSDPVASLGETPNGIASGVSGDLFISTDSAVWRLDDNWNGNDGLKVNEDIVRFDGVGADAGTVVVAASTTDGAVILAFDETSGDAVATSAPVAGVTITSVAVADGTAFVIESSGEIVSYDLTVPSPVRAPLAPSTATSEPVALVVGHTGNLFVASASGAVEEIDLATGVPVGTLFSGGPSVEPVGLAFDEKRERYLLLTAADEILEIDPSGTVLDTHESALVDRATAITYFGR